MRRYMRNQKGFSVEILIPITLVIMLISFVGLKIMRHFGTSVQNHETETSKTAFGIGIQLNEPRSEGIGVGYVVPNSPAFKAGIKAGDIIATIKKDSTATTLKTAGMTAEELRAIIRAGARGSIVVIGIFKAPGKIVPVEIVRDNFVVQ